MDDTVYIVGGGIAGMGAAHFARLHGLKPVVLEARDEIGGRAGAITDGDRTHEVGGKNFASNWRLFNGILRTFHSMAFDRQHPNFHIVLDGKLYGFDKKATLTNGLGLAQRIGPWSVLRFNSLLRQAAAQQGRLTYHGDALAELERRYDHAPLSAHVPKGLSRGPLRMFTIIMGAAEPDEFSYATLMLLMSAFGKGSHHSLPETTKHLFDRLARDVEVETRTTVRRLVVQRGRVSGIEIDRGGGPCTLPASRVVLALPLHRIARLVDLGDRGARAAAAIRYFPLAVVNADYESDVFTPEMNSIMFDPGSPLGHCSANRMYRRHSVRFTLSGRWARPILQADDATLLGTAESAFRRVHPIPGKATFAHVRRHEDGVCAYGFNYSQSRKDLLAALDHIDGLAFAGDYLFGHNMEGCLQSAMAAVHHLQGTPDAYRQTYDYPSTPGAGAQDPTGFGDETRSEAALANSH